MNVDLKYFSGTGNSYKILDTCKEIFIQNDLWFPKTHIA